jgi:hypothetical protein
MMRATHTVIVFILMIACLFSEGGASRNEQRTPLRRDFEVHDIGALDALIRLGQLYGRPMGVVGGDKKIAERQTSVRAPQTTAHEAMAVLMRQLPGYEWREDNRVIIVQPRVLAPVTKQMLSVIIPSIAAKKVDIDGLSFRLWMELQLQVDPNSHRRGFAGTGHVRDYFDLGPINLTNVTVEEVLNEIVRRRGSAAWIALPPPETLKGAPRERLWSIVTYANPPQPLDQLCCLNLQYFR